MTDAAQPGSPQRGPFARTLLRGLTLLETVAASPSGLGVTEVSERTGLDKGTASRLLATLRSMGYVVQAESDRRYHIGSRGLWLAQQFQLSQDHLGAIAQPFLAELRTSTNETVHLAIREGLFVVFVAQEEPTREIRVRSSIGMRIPLQHTAMGRAILAALPAPERDDLMARIRDAAAQVGDSTDLDTLDPDVDAARERGWAAIDYHDDVTRIAVAITRSDGEPIAALTVSGPSYRLAARVSDVAPLVVEVAHRISDEFQLSTGR